MGRTVITGRVVPAPRLYSEEAPIVWTTIVWNADGQPSIRFWIPPGLGSLRNSIVRNVHAGGKLCGQCIANRDPARHPVARRQILAFLDRL